MRKAAFNKFNRYILQPDISNKFLLNGPFLLQRIPAKIYFLYVFRHRFVYNYVIVKASLMLDSLTWRKNFSTKSTIIRIKYKKTQSQSLVFLPVNFLEFIEIMTFFWKKPLPIKKALSSFIAEDKYFLFPGFPKALRIPSWKRPINISFQSKENHNYWLFFFKTAFID